MFTVSTPCFFEFLGLLNEFFLLKKLGFEGWGWVWGSRRCACQRTDILFSYFLVFSLTFLVADMEGKPNLP